MKFNHSHQSHAEVQRRGGKAEFSAPLHLCVRISSRIPHAGIAAALLIALVTGCSRGTPRRDDLVAQPPDMDNTRLVLGHRIFVANCNQCHPGGAGGEGPALNNKRFLTSRLIRFQVRHGVGAMPRFSDERISEAELNALIAYIHTLHEERPTLARG